MKRRLFLASVVLLPLLTNSNAKADGVTVRWDIISISFPNVNPGGSASATAAGAFKITLTGKGTFQLGEDGEVSGGGAWTTYSGATVTGSGTYIVTGLIKFDVAPGSLVGTPLIDNIGKLADLHAGLAFLRIRYNDGSRGVLSVSCVLPGTPPGPQEGITASKNNVYYSNVAGGSTAFHITASED